MIYFAFLQTIILLVPIFKPIFNLFYILKTNMVKNPQRVMASVIIVRYFDLKGPKFWKNYAWNSRVTTNRDLRPNCASDQKVEENRPPFEKMGIFFFNFLIWGRVQPQIVILHHAIISRIILSWFGPLKFKPHNIFTWS